MLLARLYDSALAGLWEGFSDLLLLILCVIGGYLIKQVNRILERRRVKEHQLEFAAATDKRVKELILECRLLFDADRCYLSQFHNGEYLVSDNPILRKTRTHESVKEGRAYQAETFKGMLVSTVTEEIELVLEKGPSWTMVHELPASKFKWLCQEAGIEAIARCALYKNGKVVGFLGLDFDHCNRPQNIELLCEYAGRIESII